MNKVYTILVSENETTRMEKTLNTFRIGLNDWDRSKTLEVQNVRVVNYTIVCSEELFASIVNVMNGTRVY